MTKPLKRPRDPVELGKLIGDILTGQVEDRAQPSNDPKKNPHAVAMGKLGGRKGGPARAKKLPSNRLKEIAKKAAAARWGKR
jgi:hypothetical protein